MTGAVLVAAWLSVACNDTGADQAGERFISDLQRSHIESNVPGPSDFERLFRRDLEAYFAADRKKPVTVAFEPLRNGPTQAGLSYPKYYLWVRIDGGTRPQDRGAVRVAAIARERFDVTHFVSEADLREDATSIDEVFPLPVCDRIRAKLMR